LRQPRWEIATRDEYSLIPGWFNTDLLPTRSEVVYLDATRRFPFKNNTFDYVHSEHMIEHIEYDSALFMLRECIRLLRPGGKIPMSTPDLRVLAGLLFNETTPAQSFYVDWMTTNSCPMPLPAMKYSLSTTRFAHGPINSFMTAKQLR
jgi:SAM-dependent methyltransferase